MLNIVCVKEYLQDKGPIFKVIDDTLEKIINKLVISGEKVTKLKKEDNKCQNHK